MELSSENLYYFVFRRYKQRENKKKQELPQKFKISKMVLNPKNIEKKENKQEIINYFNTLIVNNSNISNFSYNSIDPFINECFSSLEEPLYPRPIIPSSPLKLLDSVADKKYPFINNLSLM